MQNVDTLKTTESRTDAGVGTGDLLGGSVIVEMRSAHPPYKTWQEEGYGPFVIHGETFAVTRNVGAFDSPLKWRVSHVATGIAIPHTAAETKVQARDAALNVLGGIGPEKFHAALAKARELIACA